MSEYQSIQLVVEDRIAVLTLNRPECLNAMSTELLYECIDAIESCSQRDDVQALVITGAGRGFCAGADLSEDGFIPEARKEGLGNCMRKTVNRLILAIAEAPFPIIAAVNGVAAGGGAGVVLACDFIVASESMRIILSFSQIGLTMDTGVGWYLPQLLGQKRATAMAMLAEPLDAETAKDWGLAWKVVPDAALMDESMALAQRIARGAKLCQAASKQLIRQAATGTLEELLESEAVIQDKLFNSYDHQEGVAAFLEKRPAKFEGR